MYCFLNVFHSVVLNRGITFGYSGAETLKIDFVMGMDRTIKKKSWIRRNYWKVLLVAVFVGFVLFTIILGDHSSKFRVEIDKVSVAQAKLDTFQDYIGINAITEPIQTVSLVPLVGGQVKEKILEEGNIVAKGDVILRMSNTTLEQAIIDLRADLEKERITLQESKINEETVRSGFKSQIRDMEFNIKNEQRNFEEKKYEYEQGMIPKNTYLMAKELYEYMLQKRVVLKENLKRDSILSVLKIQRFNNELSRSTARFKIEERKLDDLNVKAPVAGRLSSLNVELGGSLSKNSGFGYIRDLSKLKLMSAIDQHYSRRVSQGLKATFNIDSVIYNLFVSKVSLEVNQGQFQTELLFTDQMPEKIRVGESYYLRLQLGESKVAMLIPRGGFFQSTGGQWVYVLDPTETYAEKRVIKIGRQNNEFYEVIEGLESGEKVVVSNYDIYGDVDKLVFK